MEEFKLSDDVIGQIKDFDHRNLTEEQKLLIDKLILNKELKKNYQLYGLCDKCKQPKNNDYWCRICTFQQNFKNWTSENHDIDEFIQIAQLKAKNHKEVLEWIEYDRFENVEYLAKGGFGTIYKAIWKDGYTKNDQFERKKDHTVALKCLHNSKDITVEFLREIESHILMSNSLDVVRCFGITKDPGTNNYMMVMEYITNGSLRQHLNNNFNSLKWKDKLLQLLRISYGLKEIHSKGLIHHDFHGGNILCENKSCYITDLGLCRPADVKPSQSNDKKIYGVLPYVAPEVLKGKEYTQASDIYGFGIIAYEVCTGLPPYHDTAHNEYLAIKICQGLRPKSNYKIPQLILDVINQCWNADPLMRPKSRELHNLFYNLWNEKLFHEQIKEADEINKKLPLSTLSTGILSYTTHAQAVYTSRLLNFKNLPEPKNANDNDKNSLFGAEYSESTLMDFTKLNINGNRFVF